MKKARERKMFVAIGVLLILVGILTIWFNISYSPVKKQFQNDVAALLNENQLSVDNEIFTEKDFAHLPIAKSQPPLQVVVWVGPHKGQLHTRPKGRVSQALLLVRL